MPGDHLVSGTTCFASVPDGTVPESGGLIHRDVRHLADLRVDVEETDLSCLGGERRRPWRRSLTFAGAAPTVNDVADEDWGAGPLVLERTQQVHDGYREQITVTNHATDPRPVTLTIGFTTDFADIFEIRRAGGTIDRAIDREVGNDRVTYTYTYEDDDGLSRERATAVTFSAPPTTIREDEARFDWQLASQASNAVTVTVRPTARGPTDTAEMEESRRRDREDSAPADDGVEPRLGGEPAQISPLLGSDPVPIVTGRPGFDQSIARAGDELRALAAATSLGPVPVAGVPWFDTFFGRDGVLTSYLALPVAPALAAGTLRFLAAYQGESVDLDRDERPGKLFHELRFGELARTGAVPHSPYFGSIDATPLWIVLLDEFYRWTGDASEVERLWPPLERALSWIDRATARIGDDPFLYYETTDETGVYHKNWRDSTDSLRQQDGTDPTSPIASVEVQGYVFDAFVRVASLMRDLDSAGVDPSPSDKEPLPSRAAAYERRAERLQSRFDDAFWCDETGYYAAALADAGRSSVDTVTSNVGHCLWSGIVPSERAGAVVETLRSPRLSSGWGIRTVSSDDAAYHPVTYHRGSVWPHDTALVGLGMARAGYPGPAETVATGLLEASTRFRDHSLPEVFCGFGAPRQPVTHPAACRPQAWAAAAPFGVLRAAYDLQPTAGGTPATNAEPTGLDADGLAAVLDAWSTGGSFDDVDDWAQATGAPGETASFGPVGRKGFST